MSERLDYEHCPLSIEGISDRQGNSVERLGVLGAEHDGVFPIIAVTDRCGTFPGRGYYEPRLAEPWIYHGGHHECPPDREDIIEEMIAAWSRAGIVKLARWCRNRATEFAWHAVNAADAMRRAADAAWATAWYAPEYATNAARCAADAAWHAADAVKAVRDVAYHRQWLATFAWIHDHDARYHQEAGFK